MLSQKIVITFGFKFIQTTNLILKTVPILHHKLELNPLHHYADKVEAVGFLERGGEAGVQGAPQDIREGLPEVREALPEQELRVH